MAAVKNKNVCCSATICLPQTSTTTANKRASDFVAGSLPFVLEDFWCIVDRRLEKRSPSKRFEDVSSGIRSPETTPTPWMHGWTPTPPGDKHTQRSPSERRKRGAAEQRPRQEQKEAKPRPISF